MRILVTGGAGFVGHHFVEHFLRNTNYEIVVWDKLTYASTWDRLRGVGAFGNPRVTCLAVDIAQPVSEGVARETGRVDTVLHMAAESHVDRSITDAEPFILSNVLGTHRALDFARRCGASFAYFSTDEVFGPAPQGTDYAEEDRHMPGNPYAATKAAGEMLVMAYANTYKMQCMITRCMNLFGERQHAEKFIPLLIRKINKGERVTIHADPQCEKAGSRFYIHARNCAAAYDHLLQQGVGGTWHIVGEQEVDNLALARTIADILGKPLDFELVDFHGSRPGHDLRYSLSGAKLAAAGWAPPKTFRESLEKTVAWYLANPGWLECCVE